MNSFLGILGYILLFGNKLYQVEHFGFRTFTVKHIDHSKRFLVRSRYDIYSNAYADVKERFPMQHQVGLGQLYRDRDGPKKYRSDACQTRGSLPRINIMQRAIQILCVVSLETKHYGQYNLFGIYLYSIYISGIAS